MTEEKSEAQDLTNEQHQNNQALALQKQVGELQVEDTMSFAKMESISKTAKDNIKSIKAHMKVQVDDAHQRHKRLTALRSRLLAPYEQVVKDAVSKCDTYTEAERIKQAEIDARNAEDARKRAEDERLAQASQYESEGHTGQAEALLSTPVTPVPVPPAKEIPKRKGARDIWYAEIVDESLVPREYLTPDMAMINAIVKAKKGNTKIAGVEVKKKIGG